MHIIFQFTSFILPQKPKSLTKFIFCVANEENRVITSSDNTNNNKPLVEDEEDILERIAFRDTKLFPDEAYDSEDNDLTEALPEMSSILLSKTIFATGGNKAKNLDYYQLNFDDISDTEA